MVVVKVLSLVLRRNCGCRARSAHVSTPHPIPHVLRTLQQHNRQHDQLAANVETTTVPANNKQVPVPAVYSLLSGCIRAGSEFYVMEYVQGPHLYESPRAWVSKQPQACYDNVITVLADLHSVDYNAIGLEDYGRSVSRYVQRQLQRLLAVSERRSGIVVVAVKSSTSSSSTHQSRRFRKSSFGDSTGRLRCTLSRSRVTGAEISKWTILSFIPLPVVIAVLDWGRYRGDPSLRCRNLSMMYFIRNSPKVSALPESAA
jgi:hypothetical protein